MQCKYEQLHTMNSTTILLSIFTKKLSFFIFASTKTTFYLLQQELFNRSASKLLHIPYFNQHQTSNNE